MASSIDHNHSNGLPSRYVTQKDYLLFWVVYWNIFFYCCPRTKKQPIIKSTLHNLGLIGPGLVVFSKFFWRVGSSYNSLRGFTWHERSGMCYVRTHNTTATTTTGIYEAIFLQAMSCLLSTAILKPWCPINAIPIWF